MLLNCFLEKVVFNMIVREYGFLWIEKIEVMGVEDIGYRIYFVGIVLLFLVIL